MLQSNALLWDDLDSIEETNVEYVNYYMQKALLVVLHYFILIKFMSCIQSLRCVCVCVCVCVYIPCVCVRVCGCVCDLMCSLGEIYPLI